MQLLGDLQFSPAASRIALNRVVARGLLEPSKRGRFVFYRISRRLEAVHKEGRRQMFSRKAEVEWDGDWTLVWYSVPDKHRLERGRLSRWLNFRGFGTLQDGTWIAPGNREQDVLPLLSELSLEPYVVTFVGKLSLSLDAHKVIERGWKLEDLKRMYKIFVDRFSSYAEKDSLAQLTERDAFVLRTRLIEMFRQTVVQDPELPESVLGVEWKRKEAIDIFQELQRATSFKAVQYFRETAVGSKVAPNVKRG
ncbi:phenylacetic acid degradation operon negative regulatory protein [Amorphus sp. MBR-141]